MTSLTAASPEARVTSIQMVLTALGTRPMKDPSPVQVRPASADHPPGTTPDGFRRMTTTISVGMNNLTQVKP
jgi:hypothetical protein